MNRYLAFAMLLLCGSRLWAQPVVAPTAVSELDFLGEMPIVLSVSRLAQRLDETPGAVTILDRQFIRQSGARDVADLMRLVPGFQSTNSFETDAPGATYHGRTDDWANRIQVLVDGRSVYAGHLQGSVGVGLQTLALEDIERIEILRGSNSAAYGARAFLGVINIVSRDVRDTVGASLSLNAGQNGVRDAGARWGWGGNDATFRLSVDSRADDGLRNASFGSQITRLNGTSHFNFPNQTDLTLRFGVLGINAGRGTRGDVGNNARERFLGSQFAQVDWHATLDQDRDLAVSASHTQHTFRDSFPLLTTAYDEAFGAPYFGIPIDFSGTEKNDAISVQFTRRSSEAVRYIVGTEVRQEALVSPTSFATTGGVITHFLRLYGNIEWRAAPQWIVNAGAMIEHMSDGSNSVSPRLMTNWKLAENQTLRAGISTATRPPSGYEKYADVKYFDSNRQNPLIWTINDGKLSSEKVLVQELGYFAQFPKLSLTADVRLFQEDITNGIANNRPDPPAVPEIYNNTEASSIGGLEYQLTYQPSVDTRVFWTQSWTHIDVLNSVDRVRLYRTEGGAAPRVASLAIFQRFASNWEASLSHHYSEGSALLSADVNSYFTLRRTDVRVARSFLLGKSRAELALTIQNLGPASLDGDNKFYFERRAQVALRIEQ